MLYILVVVYNKLCKQSKTISYLEQYLKQKENPDIKVVIYDNTEYDNGNELFCKEKNYIYYGEKKNRGLSYAYNYVISKIEKRQDSWLMILDDDTEINEIFLTRTICEIHNSSEECVFLPVVKLRGREDIFSPSKCLNDYRSKPFRNIDEIKKGTDQLTAINSGMIINTSIFNTIQYNNNLFLDYVDHSFMRSIRKQNIKVKVLYICIYQNSFREQQNNIQSELFRFNIFIIDYKHYLAECKRQFVFPFSILKIALEKTIKYKNTIFIKQALRGMSTK